MNKQMREVVVLSGARTATGKFGKSLSGIDAPKIGAMALREAINRSKLKDVLQGIRWLTIYHAWSTLLETCTTFILAHMWDKALTLA